MKLFGTDGVRGKAGELLDSFLAMRLAMAAGIYFKDSAVTNNILVGKDTRRSGYMIENAIVSGLTAIGYNVIQIGPMPTPAIALNSLTRTATSWARVQRQKSKKFTAMTNSSHALKAKKTP